MTREHYFEALGDGRYQPTIHVQGAWSPEEQHVAPVIGLLLHALELNHPREDLQWARISVDILGFIRRDEMTVTTRVLRAGRTIELLEATARIDDRDTVRATAWRLVRGDTSEVAGAPEPEGTPMPAPDELPVWGGMLHWGGGFIKSLEFRSPGNEPGRGRTWVRTPLELVGGEPSSALAAWVGLLDTANGTAVRKDPREWMFPNVDLTLHLHREPEGPWVGLDTKVYFGPSGVGETSSVLHDEHGPVGTLAQCLTLRPIEP
ncbi:thioesterase family protein [Ornithinimicrobium pratense]|uniref:Thioesterase family protein n=1 Tax=Ornithinimicrobium pratense TaxID=2593973 RepID=A0A5J6V798_9MICO|nr:thioesterase family protein [Ornithinimicrobium pratense]QFG69709.1 thioesterase family protein [Ornithinimicrobium pratense]